MQCSLVRSNIQENVDLIKLQREMKEKATKFEALQVKYLNLEEVRYGILISNASKVHLHAYMSYK
jgi:protein fantom